MGIIVYILWLIWHIFHRSKPCFVDFWNNESLRAVYKVCQKIANLNVQNEWGGGVQGFLNNAKKKCNIGRGGLP